MTEQPNTTAQPDFYLLDHTDRCDKCGAQAYVETILIGGGTLTWCAHHYNQYERNIHPKTIHINDERRRLHESIKDDGHWIEGKEQSLPPRQKPSWEQ